MDFEYSAKTKALQTRVSDFMDEHVLSVELHLGEALTDVVQGTM